MTALQFSFFEKVAKDSVYYRVRAARGQQPTRLQMSVIQSDDFEYFVPPGCKGPCNQRLAPRQDAERCNRWA